MTFPSPPFPPWSRRAARTAEVVCDALLVTAAALASRGAPASVAQAFGGLQWLWPVLLGLGGICSAIGTVKAWLNLKLAGCSLSAGGLLAWAAALLVGTTSTSGQYALAAALLASIGMLAYRVVVTLSAIYTDARRGARVP